MACNKLFTLEYKKNGWNSLSVSLSASSLMSCVEGLKFKILSYIIEIFQKFGELFLKVEISNFKFNFYF